MIRSLTPALCALAGLSGLAFSPSAYAQEPEPDTPVPSLQYNAAFKVTPGEEAAISRIIEDIGDKRIVALGEISHGDGSSFLFKARLIERLHRDHGFDVLAMEGGFYDHIEAQERIAQGEQPSKAFALANFAMWTKSDQFAPLLNTIDEAAAAQRPFTLIGFDFQHSGNMHEANLKRLNDIADRLGEDGVAVRALVEIWQSLGRVREGNFRAFSSVIDSIDANRETALEAIKKAGGPNAKRDYRVIDNHAQFVRHSALYARIGLQGMGWDEFNVRDAMMATNLNIDAIQNYPDRKVVIWAATAHVMKERKSVDQVNPMVPMGYYINQGPLSDDYYVLGFSTLGGRNGTYAGQVYDIDPADPDGLETHAMKAAKGADTAFVEMPQCGESQAKVRALGYKYYTGDWGCAIDGVVVFREMQPTSYPAKPTSTPTPQPSQGG